MTETWFIMDICAGPDGDSIHHANCCGYAFPIKGEGVGTATHLNGKTGGFDAWFVPTVDSHEYTGKAGEAYPTQTGQTDVSGKWYPVPYTSVSTAGYTTEVVDAADTEEIRVQQMVRDFGFLPSDRALRYATSIGLDWNGFGVEVVGDTDEYPVVPVDGLPMGVRRTRRPKGIDAIRAWRYGRGQSHPLLPSISLT